jgi:DNA-binding FadR family transcriptional regulator
MKDHRQLIDLVSNGDVAAARELAWTHIRDARDVRLQMYAETDLGLPPF